MSYTHPIKSILQHTIDHKWKNRNLLLILCGSSVSFMINDVMGYKSPLYGRVTSIMELLPFDYLESADFFPGYSEEQKLLAYGILGGIPQYLKEFDHGKSIEENIAEKIIKNGSVLNEESQVLLRVELREPGIYNSIMGEIAEGANRINEIADKIHEEKSKCSKYLQTLVNLRLVKKEVPCGEKEESRKGIYVLCDYFFCFWYRYVFRNKNYYTLLGDRAAAKEIAESLPEYMEYVFEGICREYLIRRAKAGKLPFVPYQIGKWWGNNPDIKAQDDVDILAVSKDGEAACFCECKYTNRPMPMKEYEDLCTAVKAFPRVKNRYLIFFSKGGYTESVKRRAQEEGAMLFGIKDLFECEKAD